MLSQRSSIWFPNNPQRTTVGLQLNGHLKIGNPNAISLAHPRWIASMILVPCVYIKQDNPQDYVWRRLQVSDAQAERQKKSILQMCVTFHSRAQEIEKQDQLQLVTPNIIIFMIITKRLCLSYYNNFCMKQTSTNHKHIKAKYLGTDVSSL